MKNGMPAGRDTSDRRNRSPSVTREAAAAVFPAPRSLLRPLRPVAAALFSAPAAMQSPVRRIYAFNGLPVKIGRPILDAPLLGVEDLEWVMMRHVEKGKLDRMLLQHLLHQLLDRLDFYALQGLVDMEDEANRIARFPLVLISDEAGAFPQALQQRFRVVLERCLASCLPDQIAAVSLKNRYDTHIPGPVTEPAAADFSAANADHQFVGRHTGC